jgi:hypothetical protein
VTFIRPVTYGIPVFLMTSALFVTEVESYGPRNESCTTNGIEIGVGDDVRGIIKDANPGDTFLLRRGTHKLQSKLLMPAGTSSQPITIKPYDCEAVTLETNGDTIQPNSYNIIAGLTISATGGTGDSIKATGSSSNPRKGIVLRHNNFIGNATHSQIRFSGNLTDTTITGNDIRHARGKSVTLRLRNSGSQRPHDITIDGNKFSNCGEDCFQPEGVGSFTLSDNVFVGPADENLADIKSVQDDSFLFNNTFECQGSLDGACLLLHGVNASGASVTIDGNTFLDCPRSDDGPQVRLGRQGIANTYHVRDNTFDTSGSSCRTLVTDNCNGCDIAGNIFRD